MRYLGALIVLLSLGASVALAKPDCSTLPTHTGAFEKHCTTTTTSTTTTTTPSSTSTTTTPATTTTTNPVPTTTSFTTTTSSTTTTVPTTTTTTGTTTSTTAPSVNLTADLIVDGTTHTFSGHIEGNGHQILVINGGTLNWDEFTVNNVRRIMFTDCAGPSTLRNGEITNSGTSALGDYPLHWHLNGDCTRGTLVENVTVRNGAHHAFVPHGSHGISFLNVSAYDTQGPAFWWDPPGSNEECSFQKFCTLDNSNDIHVDNLFVDGVTNNPGDDRGFALAGVVLGAGSGNSLINSTVINVTPSHIKNCSAYHWPESANGNVGGNVWLFENNHGESACHGIFVWQNDGNLHIVDGFTGGGINHGAYGNNYDYRNVDVPYVIVHAQGWVMSDSHVGNVVLAPHTQEGDVVWTNVSVSGVIDVRDAPSGSATSPISFYINGTTITCNQVQWVNPHPDTKILIDGVVCVP